LIDFDTQALLTPNRLAISVFDWHPPEARSAANTRPVSVVVGREIPIIGRLGIQRALRNLSAHPSLR
jgi:hypothetical protein